MIIQHDIVANSIRHWSRRYTSDRKKTTLYIQHLIAALTTTNTSGSFLFWEKRVAHFKVQFPSVCTLPFSTFFRNLCIESVQNAFRRAKGTQNHPKTTKNQPEFSLNCLKSHPESMPECLKNARGHYPKSCIKP